MYFVNGNNRSVESYAKRMNLVKNAKNIVSKYGQPFEKLFIFDQELC